MQRFRILHRTYYNFSGLVRLQPHTLRLRPKEGHDLRIESSRLTITPPAMIRWHRDVEDNSVATATFEAATHQLVIESEMVIQQYNEAPLDFVVDRYATTYPFSYPPDDRVLLAPYLATGAPETARALEDWFGALWPAREPVDTTALLLRLCAHIQQNLNYQIREAPGVQSPTETLTRGTGSCRDYAYLFMEVARHLGLAARFVSGYLNAEPSPDNYGSTHAWAEVFLPGAGWKGFDPTTGLLVGRDHIAVAVARLPESVPPISGSFAGPPGAGLDVGVWVTPLD